MFLAVAWLWQKLNQPLDLSALTERAEQARQAGDHLEEVRQLHLLLDAQERKFGVNHPSLTDTLHFLGMALDKQGDSRGAEQSYRRALAIAEGSSSESTAAMESRSRLGSFYFDHGDLDAAEKVYQPGAAAELDGRSRDGVFGGLFIRNLVAIYVRRNEPRKAKELLIQALPVIEGKSGTNSSNTIDILTQLSSINDSLANHDAAEALLHEAHRRVKECHPAWPQTLNIRISFLRHYRTSDEADKYHSELASLLSLSRTNWQTDDVNALFGQSSLALSLSELGEHELAVEIQARVVREFERLPGDNHPGVLPSWRENQRDFLTSIRQKAAKDSASKRP